MSQILVQPGDLPAALKACAGGTLRLAGQHPAYDLRGIRPSARVQVFGTPGASLGPLLLSGCANLLFRSLVAEGAKGQGAKGQLGLVQTQPDCENIGFLDMTFRTVEDAGAWTPQDFVDKPFDVGLFARGKRAVNVSNSAFVNLRNGLSLNADGSYAKGNKLWNIGNDFIRLGANDVEASGNSIRQGRHSPAEPEHADAIHIYPNTGREGFFRNILVADNDIDAGNLCDYLQGISFFDGCALNVRVLRNRLLVRAWHAIALFGVDGAIVDDNVVEGLGPEKPWITVTKSKSGRPSTDVKVRRNIAPDLRVDQPAECVGNCTAAGRAF